MYFFEIASSFGATVGRCHSSTFLNHRIPPLWVRLRAPGLTLTRKSWNKGKCSHSRRGVNTAGVHTVIKVLTHYSHTVHTLAVSHTRASKSHSQLPKPSETSQASANAAIPGFFCTNAQNEPSPHRQCTKARIVTARDWNTHIRESMVSDTRRTESNTPHAQAPIRRKNDLHMLLAILAAPAGTVSHR